MATAALSPPIHSLSAPTLSAPDPATILDRGLVTEPLETTNPPNPTSPPSPEDGRWRQVCSTPSLQVPPQHIARRGSSCLRGGSVASWANGDAGGPHFDIPRTFGEAADYWKFYDEVSDKHDKDMIKILYGNLDVLLIFAGLFSAVNTAFIVLSLVDLSSPPDAHIVKILGIIAEHKPATEKDLDPPSYSPSTQNVRVNALLSASLSCSLLAAFGAVMAKQWVLHYARDTVGTLESQGRARQKKLNGVAKYRFQNVVETLPILLQISLVLFFIGLLDFLRSLNTTVALVVLAFAVTGAMVYTVTVLVATFDPQCPFQTPVSRFLQQSLLQDRRGRWRFQMLKKKMSRPARPSSISTISQIEQGYGDKPDGKIGLDDAKKHKYRKDEDKDQKDEDAAIDNQTASWLIETGSEHKDALLSTAQNIPSLRKIESTALEVDRIAFDRLFTLFKESLSTWRASGGHINPAQPGPFDAAVVFGRALCHSIVGSKREGPSFQRKAPGIRWRAWRKTRRSREMNEFVLMEMCIRAEIPQDFCAKHEKEDMPPATAFPIYIAAIFQPAVNNTDSGFRVKSEASDRRKLSQWLISMCLENPEMCSPSAVSLSAWVLGELPTLLFGGTKPFTDDAHRKKWWDSYTSERHLYPNLVSALRSFGHHDALGDASPKILSIRAPEYLEAYTALIRSIRYVINDLLRPEVTFNEATELSKAFTQVTQRVDRGLESGVGGDLPAFQNELKTTIKLVEQKRTGQSGTAGDASTNASGVPSGERGRVLQRRTTTGQAT